MGATAGLEAAAAALAAPDAPGPLSAPRLRVQGADIILEDAVSPKAPDTGEPGSAGRQLDSNGTAAVAGATSQAAGARSPAEAAAAAAAAPANHSSQQGPVQNQAAAAVLAGQQQQQQQQAAPQQHHLVAAARALQSHEHELQLRLASRTATGASNMAVVSSRPTPLNSGAGPAHGDDRLRGQEGAGDLGASSSAPIPVEGPVRMKYRSTLTEENVAYLNKLDQYTTRPDAAGRSSSERIWRWLEGSGPPFDNPPPSLGVPSVTKGGNAATASRRQADKRHGGFLSCFNCFGGGSGSTSAR